MRPIFNEKVVEKWSLWVLWTVHGTHDVLKMAKKSKFLVTDYTQYMNSSLCLPLRVQK